jgi:glycosyltransferase involved in cell wall biosynthesis
MPSPKISAIVCTYNRYDLLRRAVESLAAQSLPTSEFEIIVVDNSPDHELSKASSAEYGDFVNLKWVIEQTPGLSNARNVGTRIANGAIISFMDDDAVAASDWLANIIAGFDRFGVRAAVLGGAVKPLWGAPRPKWLHDDLLGYVSVVDWGGSARIANESEWFAGTNISFRRSVLVAMEGFSTSLGRIQSGASLLSNEEIELIGKIKERGGRLIYAPEAMVSHLVEAGRLTQQWFRRRSAWQAASDYMLAPQLRFEQAPDSWRGVLWFINKLPPRDRSLRALYMPIEDPELFKEQISAIYNYTIAILAGFNNVEL